MGVTSCATLPFLPGTHVFSTVFKLLQANSTLFKHLWLVTTWTIGNADASNAVWTSFGTDASGNWAEISSVTGDNSGVLTPANASTSSATANKGLYATVENVVVGEDGTLTLTIQGDGSKGYGLTALNYLSLTQVPEPATAALSLLGAAALFLRRRRD